MRVEIAAGNHFVRARKQDRIVGDGIGLDRQRPRGVVEQIEARAHHLRLAAEAVGILHPVAIMVAAVDAAAVEQVEQLAGDLNLSRLAAQRMDARVERGDAAFQRIDREGAGMDRRREHPLAEEQRVQRDRGRCLRAVDESEAFLGREDQPLAPHLLERVGGGHHRAGKVDPSLPHQGGNHVRQRGEVARCADGPLRGDERHRVGVEQGLQCVDHFAADTRVAPAKANQLEDDHQPRDVARKSFAKPAAVRQDQVALQVGQPVGGNAGLREQAKAGVDSIDGLGRGNDAIDRGGGGIDGGERCVGQAGGRPAP